MEKITFKDKRALNMFRVAGNCTESQLNSIISLNRIKNWQAEGLIKKESYIDKSINKWLVRHSTKIKVPSQLENTK